MEIGSLPDLLERLGLVGGWFRERKRGLGLAPQVLGDLNLQNYHD